MSALPSEGSLTYSIGEVLTLLRPDFPDTSISKIRFLDSEGVVSPKRTPSRTRRYSPEDVDQLRLVLTAQRDHYLPLKVIKERIADGSLASSLGAAPSDGGNQTDPVPSAEEESAQPQVEVEVTDGPRTVDRRPADVDLGQSFSLRELSSQSQLPLDSVQELVNLGVLDPDAANRFSGSQLLMCRAYAQLRAYGVEERHMRQVKLSASRDAFMIEQSLRHIQGPEREPAAVDLLQIFNDAHYWLALSDVRRQVPTNEQRSRRPRR
jgi:DNA-binding transcriptional MerR regulator